MRNTLLTFALSLVFATSAAAQQPPKVTFQDGRVSVDANGASVRAILAEWSKQGGTKVVGAERIAGAPLTVKLVNVTEAQALETILRSVAGYMAAPRNTVAGASMYDRIMVMATTSAPPPAAAPASRPTNNNNINPAFNGTQRFVPPRQQQLRQEQPEQDEQDEPDENPPNPPVFTFPQPQNGFSQPGAVAMPNGGQGNIIVNPAAPQPVVPINPTPMGITPTMPGSSLPGMITAPPSPVPGQRPPGRQ